MFMQKTFVTPSFWAGVTILLLSFGCMKMDMTTMTIPVNIVEGNFDTPLPIPPILSPQNLVLEAKTTPATWLQGKISSNTQLFNGNLPIIRANQGDRVNIDLKNSLTEATNIHWHGMMIPALMDGHPKDIASVGAQRNYNFVINQRATTTWFHPHPHMNTGKQVFNGLAGMFIVNDAVETALNLPSGEREIPLIISDKRFNADGSLHYAPTMAEIMTGYFGDKSLINNVVAPFLNVKTRFYRFRAVNASNARIYDLALSNGANFIIIGNDGGLLEKPISLTHALLSPGERLDILIDFSKMNVGTEVFLQSNANSIANHGATTFKMLKFKVNTAENETFSLPTILSTITPISISDSKRNRAFALPAAHTMAGMTTTMGMHTINGKVYEMNRIDETVIAGDTEIWEIDNSVGDEPHPMHLHGVQFQVLEKTNGTIQPYEKGWKDTILIQKAEKVKIMIRFPTEKGVFLMHCHNLEHEDDGMMMNFEIK
jgi:FtsP/CotA-like multicopper oxidase with cupredoxin domain